MLTIRNRILKTSLAVMILLAACSPSRKAEQSRTPEFTPYPVLKELCQSPQPLSSSQVRPLDASNRSHACQNAMLVAVQKGEELEVVQRLHELSCSETTPPDQFSCVIHENLPEAGNEQKYVTGKLPEAWLKKVAAEALARCSGEWTNAGESPWSRNHTCNIAVIGFYGSRNDRANLGKAYAALCYQGGTPTKTSDVLGGTYAPDYSSCDKAQQLGTRIDKTRAQEAAARKAADATAEAQAAARQKEEDRQREVEEAEERERQRQEERLERQQMMGAIVAGLSSAAQSIGQATGRYRGAYTPMAAGTGYSRPVAAAAGGHDMRSAQCASLASQCAGPTAECKGGTMNACYRAAACTCQAAINLGGCGQDIPSLRQCVVKNLSMVEALKTPPQPQRLPPAPSPQPEKQKHCNRYSYWGECLDSR